jgi:hypothetical protein
MLNNNSSLYLSGITYNYYQQDFWESTRAEAGSGGKFMLDLSMLYKPQRFVSRNGEWSLAWPQQIPPGFEMPTYNASFNKSFKDISDDRAREIANLINLKNQKFVVMYSGGFDSTIIMAALIKNLTQEELKNVSVCANGHSMIENPTFWKKFIWNKFKIYDSAQYKYDDLIELGLRPITADEGDCIFGTMSFLELQQNYEYYLEKVSLESRVHLSNLKSKMTSPDVHYSEYKDLIIQHWSTTNSPNLGKDWYDKFDKNIKTATVPIYSLHDYYWWILFNIKWVSCAIRISVFLNDRLDYGTVINDWAVNWFSSVNYQQWAMVNNNNGEKIESGPTTYKMAARKYIHDLDKNDWYYFFKLKLGSLGPNVMYHQEVSNLPKRLTPNARFGIDSDYNLLSIDDRDVQDYIRYHMSQFERDW